MRINKVIQWSLAAMGLMFVAAAQTTLASVTVSIQPQGLTTLVGSNVVFNAQVNVTAGETVTGYAWKTSPNGQAPFSTIANATTAALTLPNVQTNNTGSYFVSVTYNSGTNTGLSAVSTAVILTVNDPARIVVQPVASQIRVTGDTATFTVSALGAQPLVYHWRLNGAAFADSGRITGSGANSLAITGLLTNDSGNYDVVVSNPYGTATSQVSVLSVYAPPSITTQPSDLTIVASNIAMLSVTAGGSPPFTYQWQKNSNNLANAGRVSGANSNLLTIISAATNDSGSYTVIVSNPVGSITSAPANLLVLLPPMITSSTNATGQQGFAFHYATTAIGSQPITFGADGLPDGLMITPGNGVISGTPTGSGFFTVTLYATNAAITSSTNLYLNLITDVPGITSSLNITNQQGSNFTYTITASNNPTFFTATGLPAGLSLDPVAGVISGPSLLRGLFPVTITAGNQFGVDTEILMLNLLTGAPVITSKTNANGTENASFTYKITAANSPVTFGAIGLPPGLVVNPTNGAISGITSVGGTNIVVITAANAYGVGSTNLTLRIAYAPITGLVITNVTATYSTPYLLDFTFTLQDGSGNAIVRPPGQIQVQCLEGNIQNLTNQFAVPIGNETASVLGSVFSGTNSSVSELLKTFFVLDYSYSMFATPGAIDSMQLSVENLINQEPASAQFGVVEFSADYIPPIQVIGFTSDKNILTTNIDGIRSNVVQGNYAGTRFYDAMATALTNFTGTNMDEAHYLILMSDGYDDSSVLPTTPALPTQADVIISKATNANVKIYCVGFGPNPNTNVLLQMSGATGGNYYAAATPVDLPAQFALLLKDLNSQYTLRWATLQRAPIAFQPMFQVTLDGNVALFNPFQLVPTNSVDNTMMPPVTNFFMTNISAVPFYNPMTYAGNVQQGSLQLIPDSDTNISSITLHAHYIPRYVREINIHYRANYPCTPVLLSTNVGDFLSGWTLSQTNAGTNSVIVTNGMGVTNVVIGGGTNGLWLTLISPTPSNVLSSLPYGISGDLVKFQFAYQALPTAASAFSQFTIDNTVYSNLPPSGQSFVMMPTNQYVTNLPPTPPLGTPVPWLIANGFTNNFGDAELMVAANGLFVWQDYLAGLNPNDPTATFGLLPITGPQTGQPPVLTFESVLGRTYRVDASTTFNDWVPLQDNILGTGFPISVTDNRNLSGVSGVFYRLVVIY